MNLFKALQPEQPQAIEKNFVGSTLDFFSANVQGSGIDASEIIKNPYVYHWLIFAICRNIVMNITKMKWILKDKADKEIEQDDILDRLKSPSVLYDSDTFKEAIVLGLLMPSGPKEKDFGGQVFIVGRDKRGKRVDFRKGQIPESFELYCDKGNGYKVEPNVSIEGIFTGWKLTRYAANNTSLEEDFLHTEVIRIHFFNPLDPLKGLSWFTPAYNRVYQDIQSDVFNTQMLENDGTVAGVLKPKDPISQEQRRQLLRDWNERHQGAGKNSKIAAVANNIEYQQFGIKPVDMQLKDQKKFGIESILAVFGLNKIALGMYEDINLATIREGHRMLYEETYIPIVKKILSAFNNQWVQYTGDKTLELDDTDIRYLREDYTEEAGVYKTLVDTGVTPAMAAEIVGIPFTGEMITKYPWLSEKKEQPTPFGMDEEPTGDSESEDDEEEKPERTKDDKTKMLKMWLRKKSPIEKMSFANSYVEKTIKPFERKLEAKLVSFLNDLKDVMLKKIDAFYLNKSILPEREISFDDFLPSLFSANQKLKEILKPFYKEVMTSQKRQLVEESGGAVKWNLTNEKIYKFIQVRNKYITDINSTTFNDVRYSVSKIISEAYSQSKTVVEIKKLISDAVGKSIEARGGNIGTIVRTETNSIASMSRVDAFKEDGIEWVEWSAYHDEVTRDTHLEANSAEPRRIGDLFPGTNMRWPLDEEGELDEIINCRCVLIASEKNLE